MAVLSQTGSFQTNEVSDIFFRDRLTLSRQLPHSRLNLFEDLFIIEGNENFLKTVHVKDFKQ